MPAQDNTGPRRRMACPFFKLDPTLPGLNRACEGPGWFKASRVKEHLKNCHNITFYCGRCGVHVEDVGVHIANGCPAEGYLIRAVTAETTEKLKDRKLPYKCGGDEAVKWTQYWKILFPGVETRSPYVDSPTQTFIQWFPGMN